MARKKKDASNGKAAEGAGIAETVRLDKWLWASRFFKTRGLATEAVSGGHVHVNGQRMKPSRSVKVGDRLEIRKAGCDFHVDVLAVSDQRGPATVARQLYQETEESLTRRESQAAERRADRLSRPDFGYRPDKKSRRERLRLTGKANG